MCSCGASQSVSPERIIGTASAGATLTTSYETSGVTVSSAIDVGSYKTLSLFVDYRAGAAETSNICEVEVSFGPDGTNWAPYTVFTDSGSGQMDETKQYFNIDQRADALDCREIKFTDITSKWMRIRLKEEGVAANAGTATVYLTARGNS